MIMAWVPTLIASAIIAVFGLRWAKQEREEYRAKHRH